MPTPGTGVDIVHMSAMLAHMYTCAFASTHTMHALYTMHASWTLRTVRTVCTGVRCGLVFAACKQGMMVLTMVMLLWYDDSVHRGAYVLVVPHVGIVGKAFA